MVVATQASVLLLTIISAVVAFEYGHISAQEDTMESRLIGGTSVTDVNAYPYVVAVVDVSFGNVTTFGQANIINKYFALTSGYVAYTIQTNNQTLYKVISNALNVSTLNSGIFHNIANVFSHPDYPKTQYLYMNNVGLIKVCPPFMTSTFAVLPQPGQLFPAGTPCVFLGWGEDLTNLTAVDVVLESAANCSTTAWTFGFIRPFDEANDSCTLADMNKYTCYFDDGVGLFVGTTLIGIQSLGACNIIYDPVKSDVQTRVAAYAQWIVANSVY